MLEIQIVTTYDHIQSCYSVMQQLRPHLTEQEFVARVQRQLKQGYRLAYIEDDDNVKALVGFRFLEFLAWGKVLYISAFILSTIKIVRYFYTISSITTFKVTLLIPYTSNNSIPLLRQSLSVRQFMNT